MRQMRLTKVKQIVTGHTANKEGRPSKHTVTSSSQLDHLQACAGLDLTEPWFSHLKIGSRHHSYLREWH